MIHKNMTDLFSSLCLTLTPICGHDTFHQSITEMPRRPCMDGDFCMRVKVTNLTQSSL